jgi:hypothetical protein
MHKLKATILGIFLTVVILLILKLESFLLGEDVPDRDVDTLGGKRIHIYLCSIQKAIACKYIVSLLIA